MKDLDETIDKAIAKALQPVLQDMDKLSDVVRRWTDVLEWFALNRHECLAAHPEIVAQILAILEIAERKIGPKH